MKSLVKHRKLFTIKSIVHIVLRGIKLISFPRYLVDVARSQPEFIRNIALIGHIHHGKTSFMDILVEQTHNIEWTSPDSKVMFLTCEVTQTS